MVAFDDTDEAIEISSLAFPDACKLVLDLLEDLSTETDLVDTAFDAEIDLILLLLDIKCLLSPLKLTPGSFDDIQQYRL